MHFNMCGQHYKQFDACHTAAQYSYLFVSYLHQPGKIIYSIDPCK